ncbi:MAG: AMP-binding protein [Flavobacteriales bacterium]|nr:AMP-binding protein [Flavobacteriales bacterium]
MTARRKHARTIEDAFGSLTLDGKQLEHLGVYKYFDQLNNKRRKAETWKDEVYHLVLELILLGGKSISASTSGTTGTPKAMRIPRRDLVHSARLTAEAFDLKEGDRALLCLPCAYIAGKMMFVRAMALGLDLHVMDPARQRAGQSRRYQGPLPLYSDGATATAPRHSRGPCPR